MAMWEEQVTSRSTVELQVSDAALSSAAEALFCFSQAPCSSISTSAHSNSPRSNLPAQSSKEQQ